MVVILNIIVIVLRILLKMSQPVVKISMVFLSAKRIYSWENYFKIFSSNPFFFLEKFVFILFYILILFI